MAHGQDSAWCALMLVLHLIEHPVDSTWLRKRASRQGGPVDADRFDMLLRSLSEMPSRRSLARALTGFAASGALGSWLGFANTDAKKKHKHKKKKHCSPNCFDRTCGNDGCGGSCGECDGDQTCQGGNCACPAGTKDCDGACFPDDACCPPCTTGQTCQSSGSCAIECSSEDDCPAGCFCGPAEIETFCIPDPAPCDTFQQGCSSDTECPLGQACFLATCGGPDPGTCLPLCTG
jgi:hypothetical protein